MKSGKTDSVTKNSLLIIKMGSVTQHLNSFFSAENYRNAVLDYLEGIGFPELLEIIEDRVVEAENLSDGEREKLHEVLASSEFEATFKNGWPEDIEESFEEWEGSDEEFVSELEWMGI